MFKPVKLFLNSRTKDANIIFNFALIELKFLDSLHYTEILWGNIGKRIFPNFSSLIFQISPQLTSVLLKFKLNLPSNNN